MQHSEETMFSKQIAENIQMFVQHLFLPGRLSDTYHCIEKNLKKQNKTQTTKKLVSRTAYQIALTAVWK